jgi:carbon storage regulator CsrA
MLIVSRRNRESVVIGGADGFHRLFKVTVLGIQGRNVKLGFEVDPGVPVCRSEACEAIGVNGQSHRFTEVPALRATRCVRC